ncbi:hypothetical protein C8Q79DRAFT_1008228 [Trametes meyenii]|nr:hypothetical protein C8Q79DRAFT_1008228 [Trametes meyenii]
MPKILSSSHRRRFTGGAIGQTDLGEHCRLLALGTWPKSPSPAEVFIRAVLIEGYRGDASGGDVSPSTQVNLEVYNEIVRMRSVGLPTDSCEYTLIVRFDLQDVQREDEDRSAHDTDVGSCAMVAPPHAINQVTGDNPAGTELPKSTFLPVPAPRGAVAGVALASERPTAPSTAPLWSDEPPSIPPPPLKMPGSESLPISFLTPLTVPSTAALSGSHPFAPYPPLRGPTVSTNFGPPLHGAEEVPVVPSSTPFATKSSSNPNPTMANTVPFVSYGSSGVSAPGLLPTRRLSTPARQPNVSVEYRSPFVEEVLRRFLYRSRGFGVPGRGKRDRSLRTLSLRDVGLGVPVEREMDNQVKLRIVLSLQVLIYIQEQ